MNYQSKIRFKFSPNDFASLSEKLALIVPPIEWIKRPDMHQAKLATGGIINYYPSKGIIDFQGKENDALRLREDVRKILVGDSSGSKEVPRELGTKPAEHPAKYLSDSHPDNEIVIGLVGPIGAGISVVRNKLVEYLSHNFNYRVHEIKISSDIIKSLRSDIPENFQSEFDRISFFMGQGNDLRKTLGNNAVLAIGASKEINERRARYPENERNAYVIDSLKNPQEVKYLREVYGPGFYLMGVFSDEDDRKKYLNKNLGISLDDCDTLIKNDYDDELGHGQNTSNTFSLADFFLYSDECASNLEYNVHRFVDLIFGHPYITPTFEEYAMFMAFSSSLRSSDLSRQVGAVIARSNEIIASGANDSPRAGGGLYWSTLNEKDAELVDEGRDFELGEDPNTREKREIIENILDAITEDLGEDEKKKVEKALLDSPIKDIIEFNRSVHAEMEALMMCSRNNITALGASLYCTTFPCHNCAKHIVAAGIKTVVYVEPYPKSKALKLHNDSIVFGFRPADGSEQRVNFQPFVGVGPRKFFDLFSMSIGSGRATKRKDKDGKIVPFDKKIARAKLPLIPLNYIEREQEAIKAYTELIKEAD